MSFWMRLAGGAGALWLGAVLSGCTPSGQSSLSEEKEPHFVLGKSRVNAMDYQGAIEAFEQSLEANPHSAAAHFELGWLDDEKASDPAAAIYHYQEYLLLNPNADNADVIKQRIYRCKQQLAADVLPLPSAPAAQQQLEKLSDQNRQLQDEVGKWRAYYAGQLAAAKTNSTLTPDYDAPQPVENPKPVQPAQPVSAWSSGANPGRPVNSRPATATPHTHKVLAGETAMSITRKFGVRLSALQAANPGVNLSRIHTGQVLNLPAS
ncbi:MAG: LysM peptidoglycan-binding domain-containing protein [Verrucomicrobiia bacterium]